MGPESGAEAEIDDAGFAGCGGHTVDESDRDHLVFRTEFGDKGIAAGLDDDQAGRRRHARIAAQGVTAAAIPGCDAGDMGAMSAVIMGGELQPQGQGLLDLPRRA